MNEKAIREQVRQVQERVKDLQYALAQCKEKRDRVQRDKIIDELKILVRKNKRLKCQLGEYQYREEETIEFEPNRHIAADIYAWLMKD